MISPGWYSSDILAFRRRTMLEHTPTLRVLVEFQLRQEPLERSPPMVWLVTQAEAASDFEDRLSPSCTFLQKVVSHQRSAKKEV